MFNFKYFRIALITSTFIFIIFTLIYINSNVTLTTSGLHQSLPIRSSGEELIPGTYVEEEQIVPTNVSYCTFHFGFPKELGHTSHDVDFSPELGMSGPYRVLYNIIEAKMNGSIPGITYATHLTADFVYYLPELIRYWQGYISIAAFVPDTDVALVLEQLNQYCYCLPGMSRVTVHLVFHKSVVPSRKDVYFTPPDSCKVKDSSKILTYRSIDETKDYPINVCRNVARTGSVTDYVLVSDIQLMPSVNLAERFMNMLDNYKIYTICEKQVYVIPIFEVEATENIPTTKKDLINMIRQQKAVYFHKKICTHCQKFPGIEAWMLSDPGDEVKPLVTAKREVPYHRWEPIYIGTKGEPLYNEVLSWEGLQDKMLQTLEMCLTGYKFIILDGAFLVHWPGMKVTKTNEGEQWRQNFIKKNSQEYQKLLKNMTLKYRPKPECKPR